jgi:hypothetical protein
LIRAIGASEGAKACRNFSVPPCTCCWQSAMSRVINLPGALGAGGAALLAQDERLATAILGFARTGRDAQDPVLTVISTAAFKGKAR